MRREQGPSNIDIVCPNHSGCWRYLEPMLSGYLTECGLPAQRRSRFLVAISEAVDNAIGHGVPPVRLQMTLSGGRVRALIHDAGSGFSPSDEFPEELSESGRGVPMMRRLVDHFAVTVTDKGTIVSLAMEVAETTVQQYSRRLAKGYRKSTDNRYQEAHMKVDVTRDGDSAQLKLKGRLDLESSAAVKEEIRRNLAQGHVKLILDLEAVEFINSSGLGALVSALKEIRLAKGRLVVCKLAPYVREIFEITQLSHIFEIYATEGEAQEALNSDKARAKV